MQPYFCNLLSPFECFQTFGYIINNRIQVIFLNMLIAIMSDAFDQATESREVKARLTKIKIMSDYIHLIDLNDDKDEEEDSDEADEEERELPPKPAEEEKN